MSSHSGNADIQIYNGTCEDSFGKCTSTASTDHSIIQTITINEGYGYYAFSDGVGVKRGQLLGLISQNVKLKFSEDSSSLNAGYGLSNRKNFIRTLVKVEYMIEYPLTLTEPGESSFYLNLQSDLQIPSQRTQGIAVTVMTKINMTGVFNNELSSMDPIEHMCIKEGIPVQLQVAFYSWSSINLTWQWNNGTSFYHETIFTDSSDQRFSVNEVFPVGQHNITAYAENLFSNDTVSFSLCIQRPEIGRWTVEFKATPVAPPGELTITAKVPDLLPSNETFEIFYGDGSKNDFVYLPGVLVGDEIQINHTYPSGGEYTPSIMASNKVSYHRYTDVIYFYDVLKNVLVSVSTADGLKTSGSSQDGSVIFSSKNELKIEAKPIPNYVTIDEYVVSFSNGTVLMRSQTPTFSLPSLEHGDYSITVSAHIADFEIGSSQPIDFLFYEETQLKFLEKVDWVDEAQLKMNLTAKYETVGTKSCLEIICTDQVRGREVRSEKFGDPVQCKQSGVQPLHKEISITMDFDVAGAYNCRALSASPLNVDETHLENLPIFSVPCSDIELSLSPSNPIHRPYNATRGRAFKVLATVEINCNMTNNLRSTNKWYALSMNSNGTQKDTEPIFLVENNVVLKVMPKTLMYGLFKITFSYRLDGQEWPVLKEASLYVNVTPSMLIVAMTEKLQSFVTRGKNQYLKLTPSKALVNPNIDDEDEQYVYVSYFCKKIDEEYPILPESYDLQVIQYDSSTKPLKSDKGLGGCFGHGPGMVDTNGAKDFNFPMKEFVEMPGIYEIGAMLHSYFDGIMLKAISTIKLEVIDGVPPKLFLRCTNTNKCLRRGSCIEIVSNIVTGLELTWAVNWTTSTHSRFELYISINGVESKIDNGYSLYMEELYHEFANLYGGIIKVNLLPELSADYAHVDMFVLKAYVSPDGNVYGKTELCIYPIRPPIVGNCTLRTYEGAFNSKGVEVSCPDFSDPNGYDMTVSITGEDVDTKTKSILHTSDSPNSRFLLPMDQVLALDLLVTSNYGATSKIPLARNISGSSSGDLPESEDELENLLIQAKLFGDSTTVGVILNIKTSMIEQKISKTINVLFADDGPARETEINEELRLIFAEFPSKSIEPAVGLSQMGQILEKVRNQAPSLTFGNKENIAKRLLELAKDFPPDQMEADVLDTLLNLKFSSFISGINLLNQIDAMNPFYSSHSNKDLDLYNSYEINNINGYGLKSDLQVAEEQRRNSKLTSSLSDELVKSLKKSLRQRIETDASKSNIDTPNYSYEFIMGNTSRWNREVFSSPDEIVCNAMALDNCTELPPNISSVILTLKCQSLYNHEAYDNAGKSDGTSGMSDSSTVIIGMGGDVVSVNELKTQFIYKPIQDCDKNVKEMDFVEPVLDVDQFGIHHRLAFNNDDLSEAMCIKLLFKTRPSDKLYLFHRYFSTDRDTYQVKWIKYDGLDPISTEYDPGVGWIYSKCFENHFTGSLQGSNQKANGHISLAVAQFQDVVSMTIIGQGNFTLGHFSKNVTSYYVEAKQVVCRYWNEKTRMWNNIGFKGIMIKDGRQYCKWNHMTTFGSGFVVKPNTIDFDYVFENANFSDNLTIYITVILTFILYLFLLVWARIKDKSDKEKVGATPLADNSPADKYVYEVIFFTGSKSQAGTNSKVKMVLYGSNGETKIRNLEDKERKIFNKSDINSFVMTVPGPLGQLEFLRLWHDNSGHGRMKSWYVNYVIIKDVVTGLNYEFLIHNWFAVEKSDGQTDRLIPVSGLEERKSFSHLFSATSSQKLRDDHLWLSIFTRPVRSRFTRVQRVSTCMAMLYLSMLVNIMWYGTTPNKPTTGLKFGPFHLSPTQLGIGVISNLIIFPPGLIMIYIFRKSRPRYLRQSAINKVLDDSDEDNEGNNDHDTPDSKGCRRAPNHTFFEKENKQKSFSLPWYFVYVGWFLALSCILLSLFFLWAYGITFGNDKTTDWFTSLAVSFVCSMFFTQPIKVMLVSLVISLICKSDDYTESAAQVDEEEPRLKFDESWIHLNAEPKRGKMIRGLDSTLIIKNRIERQREVQMQDTIREIFVYVFFFWLLLVISYSNRDPNAHLLQKSITNTFLKNGDFHLSFYKVKTLERFHKWLKGSFIEELMVSNWYNDNPPNGLGGFINDRANFLIGMPIMRQVRVKENSCNIHGIVWNSTKNCAEYGRITVEEDRHFRVGWSLSPLDAESYEYNYQPANRVQAVPFLGQLDMYSGGGYIYPFVHPLKGQQRHYVREMDRLEADRWVDKNTRAIFFEFGIYNAQINLFSYVTFVVEMMPGGGFVPFHRIEVLQLMRYNTGFGLFILVCEVTYVAFILYMTVNLIKTFIKQKKKYFKDLRNCLEFSIVTLSYVAFGLFIFREVVTHQILEFFKLTNGTGYIRLQYVTVVNEMLGYAIAFLVFMANLKFLHLLRFNKRFGILSQTLIGCLAELSSFAVCLLIVFLAFVQLFYLILGVQMHDFSTFLSSVEACFSMMLGKFKFREITIISPFVGPLFFFVFSLATTVILLNILLTIVIKTFFDVKERLKNKRNKFEIMDYIIQKVCNSFGLWKSGHKIEPDIPTKKTVKATKGETEIFQFGNKVDKLLAYINSAYADRGAAEKMLMKHSNISKTQVFKPAMKDANSDPDPTQDPFLHLT